MVHMAMWESFCNVVHEGMSQGLPIVAADNTALKYLIKHKENGHLVPTYDHETVAKTLDYFLNEDNKDTLNQIIQNNLSFAKDNTWENTANKMDVLYHTLNTNKSNNSFIYMFLPMYRYVYHAISSTKQYIYMSILKLKVKKLGNYSQIYNAHIIEPYNVSIGHHVYINKGCDIVTTGSTVDIGNYVMFGPHVTLIAQNHDVDDWRIPMIISAKYKLGNIVIKDDVWVGANTTILSGVTINRGAVVAAGAVVTKDVPAYAIVAGIPAKVIKYRLPEENINEALDLNLDKFKDTKINWKRWGVGGIV
jgi:acetyltransferase-like isoleucine patch superfamily enzyme